MITETDRVLVRIWFKGNNQTKEAHISVQTTNLFFSIWPEEYLSILDISNLTSKLMAYEEDCALENNREADKVFSFYSLDVKKLVNWILEFANVADYIKKIRENLLVAKLSERRIEYGATSSPQGFIWGVLKLSGVNDLNTSKSSFWKMDVAESFDVNNFLKDLNNAKIVELKKYPETRKFDNDMGILTPIQPIKICMLV